MPTIHFCRTLLYYRSATWLQPTVVSESVRFSALWNTRLFLVNCFSKPLPLHAARRRSGRRTSRSAQVWTPGGQRSRTSQRRASDRSSRSQPAFESFSYMPGSCASLSRSAASPHAHRAAPSGAGHVVHSGMGCVKLAEVDPQLPHLMHAGHQRVWDDQTRGNERPNAGRRRGGVSADPAGRIERLVISGADPQWHGFNREHDCRPEHD